ncbi:MAG: MlaD family protein [Alphaproteobacteria bacterium]|nr:MlaD family protein [Alphaproteobacteria bacterium]
MSQTPNPRKIGLFMIVAFLIAIGGFFTLHWNSIFPRTMKYIMFFDGSVQGLTVSSPVIFNGVPIGKVTKITLIYNGEATFYETAVTVDVQLDSFSVLDEETQTNDVLNFEESKKYSKILIDAGLRATLVTQSLLTGQKAIDLRLHPGTPVNLKNRKMSQKVIELPTLTSFTEELNKILKNLPLEKTFEKVTSLLNELNLMAKDLNDSGFSNKVDRVAASIAEITEKANRIIQNFDVDSKSMNEINQIVHNLNETSTSLKNLVDFLERHPEALLKGK